MKKVLMFPYSNQLGTTIPSITLANLLKEDGYEIIFASRGKYTNVLKEKGFAVVPINEISYEHYRECIDDNNMRHLSPEISRHFVDMEVDLINEVKPDFIVAHNRPTLYLSSKLTNKKLVTIVVASLSNYYDYDYFIPDNHIIAKLLPIDPNLVIPASFRRFIADKTMAGCVKGFNKTLKYFGYPTIKSFYDTGEGDITLLLEVEGLVKVKDLPDNFGYLNQNVQSSFGMEYDWFENLQADHKKGKKVVYVSMGSSSYTAYPMVIKDLLNFVREHHEEYSLVSNHCGLKDIPGENGNIYIEQFINPKDVLPYVDVVITHGGKNTLNEIILAGKPVVGIPEQVEQLWNLRYVEELGFGRVLSRFKLQKDIGSLRKAVLEVIKDQSYNERVEKFSKSIHQEDYKSKIRELINKYV